MARQVLGLFERASDAQAAVQALRDAGVDSNDISLVARDTSQPADAASTGSGDVAEGAGAGAVAGSVFGGLTGLLVGVGALAIPGIGPAITAGTLGATLASTAAGAAIGAASGGLLGALLGAGIPEVDANVYVEGIRRGGVLVAVQVRNDDEADRIVDLLNRQGVVDIDERAGDYRAGGWTDESVGLSTGDRDAGQSYADSIQVGTVTGGMAGVMTGSVLGADQPSGSLMMNGEAGTAIPSTPTAATTPALHSRPPTILEAGATVPVIEERLQVTKRVVESGGVRVQVRIVEVPVDQQVKLLEERVTVKRRPVEGILEGENVVTFQPKTIEARQRGEDLVVRKHARVVNEIAITKQVQSRTETIQDTVRRTEVDVQRLERKDEG